ncbi:MAG TPA: hypothetical protein VKO41_07640 [Gaiellaceae bacterium]|nr:hypothetical protein [Gaiellaceae bacterium]
MFAADAVAVSIVIRAGRPTPLALLAAAVGVAFVVAALLVVWEDGLVAGPAFLLLAYGISLADNGTALDRTAPLVSVGLVAVVELGSWSLELRDGAEEQPLRRLPSIGLLLITTLLASALLLVVGGVRPAGGIALWAIGALAAIGVLVLIRRPLAAEDVGG